MDAEEPDAGYRAALAWIWDFSTGAPIGLPGSPRRENKLERMRALLALVGNPERRFRSTLVAGTKGKGSTVAMLSEIMRATGLKVGRYTSPHLLNWRERTWVDGQLITPAQVVAITADLRTAVAALPESLGRPTTFEVGTALTFLHFVNEAVDVAIVEAGVGGATDATNTMDPLVSVITSVSYDHTQTLGPTLTDIARHKSGIMRPGRPVISAPQMPEAAREIERFAEELPARLIQVVAPPQSPGLPTSRAGTTAPSRSIHSASSAEQTPASAGSGSSTSIEPGHASPQASSLTWTHGSNSTLLVHTQHGESLELTPALVGDHQANNLACALGAATELARLLNVTLTQEAVQQGLDSVAWPGRLQVVGHSPLLVLDGAHNGDSAQALAHAIRSDFTYDKLHLILGLTADKDMRGILEPLLPLAERFIVTRSHHERAAEESGIFALASELAHGTKVLAEPSLAKALEMATTDSGPNDLVLVTGSLFLVGEALDWARDQSARAGD